MKRLRTGDWILLLGALAVPVTLVLDWFEPARSGFDALGWPAPALLLPVAALGLAVVLLIAAGTRDAVNLPPAVFLAALTPPVFLVALTVVLLKPGDASGIATGGWLGLLALAVLTIGAWRSIGDERTDQASRQVPLPPARQAPPA
jgi:hypothetical protein